MKIYFIRHAEGSHNLPSSNNNNYNIAYPKITENGFSQINNTKNLLKDEEIELILVSPLTRTLQTAGGIFDKEVDLFIANENIREVVANPCDLRKNIDELQIEFPYIDFSEVNNNEKFSINETRESYNLRMEKFYNWLQGKKYKSIAIVTHGVFLHKFIEKYGEQLNVKDKSYFKNCEYRIGEI